MLAAYRHTPAEWPSDSSSVQPADAFSKAAPQVALSLSLRPFYRLVLPGTFFAWLSSGAQRTLCIWGVPEVSSWFLNSKDWCCLADTPLVLLGLSLPEHLPVLTLRSKSGTGTL